MEIRFGGVYLSRADFDDSFRDYVAFSIAFAANTGCRDKEAALELLRYEADSLIEKSRVGLLAACEELVADLLSHASLGLNDKEVAMLKRAETAIAAARGQ